jgi:transposase-like protein
MVKAMDIRFKAVVFYSEGARTAAELSRLYGFSERTLRRWSRNFKASGIDDLKPDRQGNQNQRKIPCLGRKEN